MDKVSDINKVNKLSRMIYKKNIEPSTRKNKKYMIMNDDQIKGNWKKDKYSPNNLAINLLWNNSKAI